MLEEQQSWLVNGLRELYHRAVQGQGWPGEPLKLEPNGFPLTHDMVTQLGALNKKPEMPQRELNITLQHECERRSRESALATPSIQPSWADLSQQTIPPTPTTSNESPLDIQIFHPENMLRSSHFEPQRTEIFDPWGSQNPQRWPTEDFGLFDDMEMMIAAKNPNLLFDDPFLYENLEVFTDGNATEITLI